MTTAQNWGARRRYMENRVIYDVEDVDEFFNGTFPGQLSSLGVGLGTRLGCKSWTDISMTGKDVSLSLAGTLNRSYQIGLWRESYGRKLIWNRSCKIRLFKLHTTLKWVSRPQLILVTGKDVSLSPAGTLNRSYKIGLLRASYGRKVIWNRSCKIRLFKLHTTLNWVSRPQQILVTGKDVSLSLAGTLNGSYKIGLLRASYDRKLIWNRSCKIMLFKLHNTLNWVARAQLILVCQEKMFLWGWLEL